MPIRSDYLDSFDDEDDEFENDMDLDEGPDFSEHEFWEEFGGNYEWDDDSSREMWDEPG